MFLVQEKLKISQKQQEIQEFNQVQLIRKITRKILQEFEKPILNYLLKIST